ncbi:TrmH family RNA methyltransferase [Candidatus Saccharibacteria bacterium]|nr:TrmH family RNA methyltransferase [Candidatus Saccharibacteria bacterium]
MHITLVAHDIRSTHNVGAFFRTCDGLGVDEIIFSGYTPYPSLEDDTRLPHFADKLTRQIHKTALGAECTVPFKYTETLEDVITNLKQDNTLLVALEQFPDSLNPKDCVQKIQADYPNRRIALIVGNEIHGVSDETLKQMDYIMEIPMHGTKESLNVSVATAIALYELTGSSI